MATGIANCLLRPFPPGNVHSRFRYPLMEQTTSFGLPAVPSLAMIRLRTQQRAPHLVIELNDTVSGHDVRQELTNLPELLSTLPARFVALIVYSEVHFFEAETVGPLFYYVTHLFDADPGLCVFVDGGRSPHPGLRSFIHQIGLKDQSVFVPTRNEADTQIRSFMQKRKG